MEVALAMDRWRIFHILMRLILCEIASCGVSGGEALSCALAKHTVEWCLRVKYLLTWINGWGGGNLIRIFHRVKWETANDGKNVFFPFQLNYDIRAACGGLRLRRKTSGELIWTIIKFLPRASFFAVLGKLCWKITQSFSCNSLATTAARVWVCKSFFISTQRRTKMLWSLRDLLSISSTFFFTTQ